MTGGYLLGWLVVGCLAWLLVYVGMCVRCVGTQNAEAGLVRNKNARDTSPHGRTPKQWIITYVVFGKLVGGLIRGA